VHPHPERGVVELERTEFAASLKRRNRWYGELAQNEGVFGNYNPPNLKLTHRQDGSEYRIPHSEPAILASLL